METPADNPWTAEWAVPSFHVGTGTKAGSAAFPSVIAAKRELKTTFWPNKIASRHALVGFPTIINFYRNFTPSFKVFVSAPFTKSGNHGDIYWFTTSSLFYPLISEIDNPCALGEPQMISPNEARFCSISNPLTCADSYWCHFGATEQTTLCCPGRGVLIRFFPFWTFFSSLFFPFKFNPRRCASNPWPRELGMPSSPDGITTPSHSAAFNSRIADEWETKIISCPAKNANNNVVRFVG